jgi:hypothetical protein
MGLENFQKVLDSLAEQYGRLDNQVERWIGTQQGLVELFPQIEQALQNSFADGSAPLEIFTKGRDTYLNLLAELSGNGPAGEIPAAFLNLRFYILLNAFLQACLESLAKSDGNPALDPAQLVEKSYYKPFFFDRSALKRTEAIQILEDEIRQLQRAARDRRGIRQALRVRNGVSVTLAETYCPCHPMLYPLVQELDAIKASTDPTLIDDLETKLKEILNAI